MLVRHPGQTEVLCDWSGSGDRWLVRVAVTAQLGRGAGTDADRLFGVCARHGTDPEFFVAKAVGWALRDYARTDPAAVAAFVAAHAELAPLARREALKHLA
jgi:3-methyladenine DNA glycosylase AlkD